MVGFSLAVLAGYGAARIGERLRSPAARRAVFVAIGALMLVEYASTPLPLWRPPAAPPQAYADIIRDRGDSPTAVLFEFPTGHMEDPEYLYYSTFHWQYLVNGYSGFFPPSYLRVVKAVQNFPDATSFDVIKSHGARYIVIHGEWLYGARYVTLVADGEPGAAPGDPDRAEALVTLAQALNGPTRCALVVLRGGGNRSGADAVVTWQTGFPFAVDFAPGFPTYRPHAGAAALLATGEIDAALVIGSPASIPEPLLRGLAGLPSVAIGPRASAATFQPTVAVDTGVAGIHEGGTAFRMDDVPLPLRPPLAGPPTAAGALRSLRERLGA